MTQTTGNDGGNSSAKDAEAPGLKIEEERLPAPEITYRLFWELAGGFWRGRTRGLAAWLTAGVAASVLFNIALQYVLNLWNKYFFDALDSRAVDTVWNAVFLFAILGAVAITAMAAQVWVKMSLQANWRRWLTSDLAGAWLSDRRFYQMNIAAPEVDGPEFRMTDDVRVVIDTMVDFAIGLSNAILMAAVFAGVLWSIGGGINAFGIVIPGYFVWAAAGYGFLASLLTLWVGRPLIERTERKNAAEAQNRFELVRVRENAESIALIGGEEDERGSIEHTLSDVLARWKDVIRHQSRITFIIHGNTILAPVIPLLLGAPKYLSGEMSLGQLMQISAAFLQVQVAFNWLVENFFRLAEWSASARRVLELSRTLSGFKLRELEEQRIEVREGDDARLRLIDLSVEQHNGRIVINSAEMVIECGEKILLKGASGSGKSTLIRAIAGLWPWGSGTIVMPSKSRVMFVPQRPYIPNGTLRNALMYPELDTPRGDDALKAALKRCGLRSLGAQLDTEARWDKSLSGGEQQRLAFARLVVHRPEVIVLDEATSALDEAGQVDLMSLFHEELAYATLVSVGHRPGLEDYHDRVIELTMRDTGAEIRENVQKSHNVAAVVRDFLKRTFPVSSG